MLAECHYCERGLRLSNVGMYISSLAGSCFMGSGQFNADGLRHTLLRLKLRLLSGLNSSRPRGRALPLTACKASALIVPQSRCHHHLSMLPSCRLCCLGSISPATWQTVECPSIHGIYIYNSLIVDTGIRCLTVSIQWQGS